MSAQAPLPVPSAAPMLLDRILPEFDATRIEHRVVEGAVASVYDAVLRADFIRAWKDHAAVRTLFAARAAAEDLLTRIRGSSPDRPPAPESLRIGDLSAHGDWVKLGADPPHEIVVGVIGRFWAGQTTWEQIDAADFTGFARPGFAKIGANLSLRPYGARRTLVSYEARTKATDDEARLQFLRYWQPVSPGAGVVMRAMLAVVEAEGKTA